MKELVETTVNACAAAFARPSPQKPSTTKEKPIDDNDYHTEHAAFALIQKDIEWKPFDEAKVKGGKICINHITSTCKAGDACPFHHTKNKRICIFFNTKVLVW